jgi:hypothetical protein
LPKDALQHPWFQHVFRDQEDISPMPRQLKVLVEKQENKLIDHDMLQKLQ